MNIGDLVTVKDTARLPPHLGPKSPGIIIDSIELDDGFVEYEVMFETWGIGWFSDLMLVGANEKE